MKRGLFSIGDILAVLMFVYVIIFRTGWFMNADGDILWHIKQGEWYIANKTWYINKELFSYMFDFREWIYLSWLSDIVFAVINKYLGFQGLIIFTDLLIVMTLYFIYRYLIKKGINFFVIIFIIIFGMELPATHWIVRNHIFGQLFLVVWFIVLEKYYEGKINRLVFLLPILNIVWVNMHGSFLYGMTLPVFFAAGAAFDVFVKKEEAKKKILMGLIGVGLLSLLTALINPFGIKYFGSFLGSKEMAEFIKGNIGDFSSAKFNMGIMEKVNIFLGMVLFIFLIVKKRIKIHYFLIILFYYYRAIFYSRDISILGLLFILIIPQIIDFDFLKSGMSNKISSWIRDVEIKKYRWTIIPMMIIVVLFTLYVPYIKGFLDRNSKLSEYKFPVGAVDFVKENNLTGRFFHSYIYGGYLIWRFYPEKVTMTDTRGSIFEYYSYMECMYILYGFIPPDKFIDKYEVKYFLLDKSRETGLINVMKLKKEKYSLLYEDSTSILFQVTKKGEIK